MTSPVCSDWPTLVGRQEPEYLLVDDGDQSEADKAVELARRVQKAQMPWQEATLRGELAIKPNGRWVHPTVVIIAPRQNGKTLSAAELRILHGLFSRREKIVYSAQRWTTAKAIYLRLKKLISSRPSLKARVPTQGGWICSQGVAQITVRFDDGEEAVAMFITRGPDFRGPDEIDLVFYDEAYNLTDAETAAISPTQLASKNPQTVYLSTAVNEDIHPFGEMLTRIRSRALAAIMDGRSGIGIYYAEYCAPPPDPDWSDARRRAVRESVDTAILANPSFGVIQDDEKVVKLQTDLSTTSYEVEVLGWGRWPAIGEDRERLFNADGWEDQRDPSPRLVGPKAVAVWRSLNRKRWAIAQAQRTTTGRVHIEIGPLRTGSHSDVAAYLGSRAATWNPIAVGIDSKNAANVLEPLLIEVGSEPTMLNTSDIAHFCGGFLDDANDGRLSHSGQQELDDAIAAAAKRKLPGGDFAWQEDDSGTAGPLIAASEAHGLILRHVPAAVTPAAPVTGARDEHDDHEHEMHDELDVFAI